MSRRLTIRIEAEQRDDGKTEMTLSVDGATREQDMGTIMLQLGKDFGLSKRQWAILAMAAMSGETAIGGRISEEISMGGRRPVKE